MKILLLWICISISMYINFKNKNEESSLNINYIWDCFIGDWKLYIFYYCIFYYLFLQTSIPAPNKPIWQYYFPLKLSVNDGLYFCKSSWLFQKFIKQKRT